MHSNSTAVDFAQSGVHERTMTAQLFVCLDRVMNDNASSVASDLVSVTPQSNKTRIPSLLNIGGIVSVYCMA